MPIYRRAHVPGGTFFFTVVTEGRHRILCDDLGRKCLREALSECRVRWLFTIEALVLLPDHLHTVWTLPDSDTNFSRRWAFTKKQFTKGWLRGGGSEAARSESRERNRRRGVWQRRFWEHAIRDGNDLRRHLDYMYYNPVKHGLVRCPHAWRHSTFHRDVRLGAYRADWGCGCRGATATSMEFSDLNETAME